MLSLLTHSKSCGLNKVLITCDKTNLASATLLRVMVDTENEICEDGE